MDDCVLVSGSSSVVILAVCVDSVHELRVTSQGAKSVFAALMTGKEKEGYVKDAGGAYEQQAPLAPAAPGQAMPM